MANEWKVYFYTKSSNQRQPVKDFLSDIEKDKRIKALKYLKFLKKKGLIGRPYCDKVEGLIYELRPKNIRILFGTYKRRRIITLTGFIKKRSKIPRKEIERAKRYYRDFKNNPKITLKS